MDNILEIQNLKLIILLNQEFSNQLNIKAVDDISFYN